MSFLVTGSAGFIGFHLCQRLLSEGSHVLGYDALTPHYDPTLKQGRLDLLRKRAKFSQITGRLEDTALLLRSAEDAKVDVIFHLAAQPGVRYSLENPRSYIDSNLTGSWSVLEMARAIKAKHVMIASTSSIYGGNRKVPFDETDRTDEPLSLYAATKKGMEAMAYSYAHLFHIPVTAFRFFTVYGPWGRPDMALFKFTRAIIEGSPIEVYGEGKMRRDFTYVEDLVEAIVRLSRLPPGEAEGAPYRAVNIGGGQPAGLLDFIAVIEKAIGKKAIRKMLPMQPGDMTETYASAELLHSLTGYAPTTSLEAGVSSFVNWYRAYYKV